MPIKLDCGDLELTLNIIFGVKKASEPIDFEGMLAKVQEIKPNLEKTVLSQIAEHIGYDQETIDAKIHERDEKIAASRAAEDKGRAEKAALRSGLPPLEPPPPMETTPAMPNAAEKPN